MRGGRVVAVMLVMSIMSACAGQTQPKIDSRLPDNQPGSAESYAETIENMTAGNRPQELSSIQQSLVPAVHRESARDHPPEDDTYHHAEPSPQAQRAAEAALIVTGSLFLCTFVVVILDGACEFGVGFGYHYY